MKTLALILTFVAGLSIFPAAALADSKALNDFLTSVDTEAQADRDAFIKKLSTQFLVPVPKVENIVGMTDRPSDAFMLFWMSRTAHKSIDAVLRMNDNRIMKGKDWRWMAQKLNIKTSTEAFYQLANGLLSFTGNSKDGKN